MSAGPGRCYDAVAGRNHDRRDIRLSYTILRFAALASGLLMAATAQALSLGELEIASGLGQPFSASVRYVTPRADDVHALCIRAGASSPTAAGVPALPDPRFDVEPGQGGGVIRIRTARPVNEPLMRLQMTVNCGPSVTLIREFAIILDPPRTDLPVPRSTPASAAAAAAAASAAPAIPPATPAARPRDELAMAAAIERRAARQRATQARQGAAAPVQPRAQAPGALPYEPGVTPRPGSRAARQAEQAQPRYRLSLSRPGDEGPANPNLRASDSLEMRTAPASAQEQEVLRKMWRLRQADDPFSRLMQLDDQMTRLEKGLADLRSQVGAIAQERDAAKKRIEQLEAEKQQASTWLNGMALALGFIGCVALAALAFWSFRRRAEERSAHARHLANQAAQRPGVPAARIEPGLSEEEAYEDVAPWRPEPPAAAPPAIAPPPVPAPAPRPPRGRPMMGATPPSMAPRVPTPQPTPPGITPPPAVLAASSDDTYTATVEMPHKTPPPVEDFYTNPPLGAPDPEVDGAEPPAPAALVMPEMPVAAPRHDETSAVDLPDIAFDLPPPPLSPEQVKDGVKAEAAAPLFSGDDFSIEFAPVPKGADAPAAPAVPAAPAADPFADVGEPPPPPAVATTLVDQAVPREPTPTMARMKVLVDELAAAQLGGTPPPGVTAAHRALDIELGADDDAEMRAQLYRQEFELKLFPEIVHGKAKLKVPQSIISLARTYYQEDFDTNRAINLLEYAADRTPDPQRVRLALLEILRMEGMGREYVAVASAFQRQFPDAEEWDTVSAYGKLLVPGDRLFADADAVGYDLNMPSMWLGSTLDMTRYVLAQDLHDAMHGPAAGAEGA